jgi:hypothetical protein
VPACAKASAKASGGQVSEGKRAGLPPLILKRGTLILRLCSLRQGFGVSSAERSGQVLHASKTLRFKSQVPSSKYQTNSNFQIQNCLVL